MPRITEPDLILPALYVIYNQPDVTTGELIVELRSIFNPAGEDAEILQGRNDDKFSQIVRNLVSHRTLDQRYQFTVLSNAEGVNTHTLTEHGLIYLRENLSSLESLLSNRLGYLDTIVGVAEIFQAQATGKKIIVFDENLFISEGKKKTVTTQVHERSKQLRDMAIAHYTKDGKIVCAACGFDFYEKYGEVGRGYIEIHHQKPVFQYEQSDFSRLVLDALKDLIPLCANCHRIVHRKKDKPLSLKDLVDIVSRYNS